VPLRPGQDGEPLPAGEWVLRLAVLTQDIRETGRPSPKAFELSSEDRQGTPPRLSVWAERLTTPHQAWLLMGARPQCRLVLRLGVDTIRSLRPEPDSPDVPALDVPWERLMIRDENGRLVPDTRPGAEGHAGITGLAREGGLTRLHTKSLRSQLADTAIALLLNRDAPTEPPASWTG
jgi:hypothetical protein